MPTVNTQRPASLSHAKIVVLCTSIRSNARGVMLSALWKARRFAERGFPTEIRTLDFTFDFAHTRQELTSSGRLSSLVAAINVQEFLITPPRGAIAAAPLNDGFNYPNHSHIKPEVATHDGIVRFRLWRNANDLSYTEFYRPDGSLYLRAMARERSLMDGARFIEWVNSSGTVVGQFVDVRALWRFWLTWDLNEHESLFIIQDGQYFGSDKREMLSNICLGSSIYNIAVAHGATLRNGRDPASDPVPGWAKSNRFGDPDQMIFLTDEQREIWQKRFPEQHGLTTIPHEVRVDDFEFSPRIDDRIVSIASLTALKRLDHLISAFAMASKTKPGLTLQIIGEGPLHKDLAELASELEVSNQVEFCGYQPSPERYLRGAAVSVITSDREAFGMPILESMGVGTPVVSYDIEYGPRYIIKDGVHGWLVPRNNIDALTAALIEAVSDSPENTIRRHASFHRAKDFSGEIITDKWISLLARMASDRHIERNL